MSNPSPFPINDLLYGDTAEQSLLEEVEVEYITMPGWKTSTAHVKSMDDLPPNAQNYVSKLQELIGVKSEYGGRGWLQG